MGRDGRVKGFRILDWGAAGVEVVRGEFKRRRELSIVNWRLSIVNEEIEEGVGLELDDAEGVAVGVGEDGVVGVWLVVPVYGGCA